MKVTKLAYLLVLGLVLTLGASGCKKNPYGVTPLPKPARSGGVGDPSNTAPIDGGTGADDKAKGSDTGIPLGAGHPDWTQDREGFKQDTVYFDLDSSVVKSTEKAKVQAVADYLKSHGANAVLVEGHCDERGTEEYNRALGERRALALREVLVGLGIDSTRVDTISHGKDHRVDLGNTNAAHQKNRRGEFVLLTEPSK